MQAVRCVVIGAVINNDDLQRWNCLSQNTLERLRKILAAVVGRDDDTDTRRAHSFLTATEFSMHSPRSQNGKAPRPSVACDETHVEIECDQSQGAGERDPTDEIRVEPRQQG